MHWFCAHFSQGETGDAAWGCGFTVPEAQENGRAARDKTAHDIVRVLQET